MMSDMWMGHEVFAATLIRQARRAKAHRRRQCQTLSEIGRKKVFIGGVYLKGSKTIISMEKFMVFLKISK